jgi:hypothetical protein
MTTYRSLAVLLGAAVLASCGDKGVQDITAPPPGAAVKFFNFGVNTPGVNFFANDTKVTAISSTSCTPLTSASDPNCLTKGVESTNGVASGAVAAGGLYNGVLPGQYTLSGRISAATDNGLSISSTPTSLENGKYYSYYLSGIYDAGAKKVDAFVVEDAFPLAPDPTKTYIRFVNAISNSQPMTLVLTASGLGEATVGTAVAYKNATPFIAFNGGGLADLSTRVAGSTANVITRTGVSFSPGRVYTVTARGDMTVTSSTAATRPQLDNTANR